jgi:hypothetical protein
LLILQRAAEQKSARVRNKSGFEKIMCTATVNVDRRAFRRDLVLIRHEVLTMARIRSPRGAGASALRRRPEGSLVRKKLKCEINRTARELSLLWRSLPSGPCACSAKMPISEVTVKGSFAG